MTSANGKQGAFTGKEWLLIVLGLVVVASFGIRTISNSDFWLHLAGGRLVAEQGAPRIDSLSFASAGSAWVNSTWLYDRLLYMLWNIGGSGLVILDNVGCIVVGLLLLVFVAKKWAGANSITLALLISAWLIAPRFVVGPVSPALFTAAVFIYMLSCVKKKWLQYLVVLLAQLFWTNIHPSFLLGPIIVVCFAIEAWLRVRSEPDNVSARSSAMAMSGLLVGTLLVSFLNPYGLGLHRHAVMMGVGVASSYVREWISPFSGQFKNAVAAKHIVTIALLLGAGGLVTERRKLPLGVTSIAVVSAFLVVRSLWFVDFFAILAFPFLALSLCAIGGFLKDSASSLLKEKTAGLQRGLTTLIILLAVFSLGTVVSGEYYMSSGSVSSFGLGAEYDLFPNSAAKIIERTDFPARAFNGITDGGFLLWKYPGRAVYVDGRAGVHDETLFVELNKCLAGADDAWKEFEANWEPGAAIINCNTPGVGFVVRSLLQSQRWVLGYFDGTTVVLLRATSSNQSIVQDGDLQKEGLAVLERERMRYAKELGGWKSPGNSPRLVGAANLYMALGRYDEAASVLGLLVRGTPAMANAWLNLGIAETQNGDLGAAQAALDRAAELMPKNVWPLLHLSRVCALKGDKAGETAALDKARQLSPTAVAAFMDMENSGAQQ